jgi:hypothetical protein
MEVVTQISIWTSVLILSLGHGICDGIIPFNATIENMV